MPDAQAYKHQPVVNQYQEANQRQTDIQGHTCTGTCTDTDIEKERGKEKERE